MPVITEDYAILSGREELLNAGHFPDWVNLSALITLGGERDVERHYHHYEEVWLWQEGAARAWSEGIEISMRPGMLSYTPADRQHSFDTEGYHSLTLIVPRIPEGERWGHLHLDKTADVLQPTDNSILLMPEQTGLDSDYCFPVHSFAKQMLCGACEAGTKISICQERSWEALLINSGAVNVTIDAVETQLHADQCICIAAGNSVEIVVKEKANIVRVLGQ